MPTKCLQTMLEKYSLRYGMTIFFSPHEYAYIFFVRLKRTCSFPCCENSSMGWNWGMYAAGSRSTLPPVLLHVLRHLLKKIMGGGSESTREWPTLPPPPCLRRCHPSSIFSGCHTSSGPGCWQQTLVVKPAAANLPFIQRRTRGEYSPSSLHASQKKGFFNSNTCSSITYRYSSVGYDRQQQYYKQQP